MRHVLVSAIALALATLSVAAVAADTPASAAQQTTTQLPRNVRPSHYDVDIFPHAATLGFDGKVSVALEVLEPTSAITLNAVDMVFTQVRLLTRQGQPVSDAPKVTVDAAAQTATFTFAQPVKPGEYTLAMEYSGKIGTQANGLFAIDYDTKAGRKRALYTQFENSDARKLVPSWDEPAYKATFTLSATVPAGDMAVSNMPVATRKELGNGLSKVSFPSSPKMSTYLLFFATGDFERATAMADGTEVGVVAQKGAIAQADFALNAAKLILPDYNEYFGTPYPLPKLDNVASPGRSQFFGAMENWGAIYTFEYALLVDPSISTQADKQRIFSITAHEMAHQWFGDLVTMRWWDDLWLNEGFASWMEGRTTAKLHPEWNTELEAVGVRESAMGRDAIVTTHPVVQHVETVEQANQAFDSITYSKGEAVIRMLEGYVGADAWRDGVRRYMKAHAYGNTVSDDLWREVEAAAGKPIQDIAHDFTLQPGVPLIRVGAAICRDGKTQVSLEQGEFTKDRPGKQPLAWRVPVIARAIGDQGEGRTLVEGGKGMITVPGCGPVLVNAGQSGYYRTLYPAAQLAAIRGRFAELPAMDQLGLLSDVWALALSDLQTAGDYLDLAQATPADADPQVWGEIASGLDGIDSMYDGDQKRQDRFRAFAIQRLAPLFARIGWEAKAGESAPVTNLRTRLIGSLGALGDARVIAEARRRYAADRSDPTAMPAALRKTVLAIVARNADAATWDKLHAAALAEKTPLVKDELYSLLSVAQEEALAKRALDLAMTDEPGATNTTGMVSGVAGRHPDLAFDFAMAHREQLDLRVDSTSRSSYYPGLGSGSVKPEMIGKIEDYATRYIAGGSRRASKTAVVNIQNRIKVRAAKLPEIDAWLASHGH